MDKNKLYIIGKQVALALLVVLLLLLATNQFLAYKYKMTMIQQPCNLCIKQHPEFLDAINMYMISKNQQENNWLNITIPKS